MELLDDMCHMESHIGPFRDRYFRCKIGARFAPNAPYYKKLFWTHPMVLLGQRAQVKAWFGLFGDSANLDAR